MLLDAYTLVLIANRLEEPIDCFVSEMYRKAQPLEEREISNLEKELIIQFRRISDRGTEELLIRQVEAAADVDGDT
jgi:hypothetical protein